MRRGRECGGIPRADGVTDAGQFLGIILAEDCDHVIEEVLVAVYNFERLIPVEGRAFRKSNFVHRRVIGGSNSVL